MTPELWERLTRSVRDRSDTHPCPDCRGVGYAGDDDEHPCHECSGSGGVPGQWEFHAFGPVRVEMKEEVGGG